MTLHAGSTRVIAWNIEQGGVDRIPRILDVIAERKPAIITLSEVTGKYLPRLRDGLAEIGLPHIEATCPDQKTNSVLVASAMPVELVDDSIAKDGERWLPIWIPSLELHMLCVHIPGSPDHKWFSDGSGIKGSFRKARFWYEVTRYAEAMRNERCIILGDFNTGCNTLDRMPDGDTFECADNLGVLRMAGYRDVYREQEPRGRTYTWWSRSKVTGEELNGFRLDHIFVSAALREGILAVQHHDHVRGLVDDGGLSDHSIVEADLDIVMRAIKRSA